jgi:hypothetical protein
MELHVVRRNASNPPFDLLAPLEAPRSALHFVPCDTPKLRANKDGRFITQEYDIAARKHVVRGISPRPTNLYDGSIAARADPWR